MLGGREGLYPSASRLFCQLLAQEKEAASSAQIKSVHFKVINWAKSELLTGPRSFLHYKNRDFRRFCFCSVIIVCVFLFPIIWQFSKNSLFQKGAKICFSIFCVVSLNFENSLF